MTMTMTLTLSDLGLPGQGSDASPPDRPVSPSTTPDQASTPASFALRYVKTATGQAALLQRNGPLGARQRQLLILIDGQRDLPGLASLMPPDQLVAQLEILESLGLIARRKHDSHPAPIPAARTALPRHPLHEAAGGRLTSPPAPPTGAPPVTRPPSPDDKRRLRAAKALMQESTLGLLGALGGPILRDIERLDHLDKLPILTARWNMALRETPRGAAEADRLMAQLGALLAADSRNAPAPT